MKDDIAKGFVGTASPILGVITSFQEQLEFWIRFSSLLIGLAVGVFTLISIIKGLRRKQP